MKSNPLQSVSSSLSLSPSSSLSLRTMLVSSPKKSSLVLLFCLVILFSVSTLPSSILLISNTTDDGDTSKKVTTAKSNNDHTSTSSDHNDQHDTTNIASKKQLLPNCKVDLIPSTLSSHNIHLISKSTSIPITTTDNAVRWSHRQQNIPPSNIHSIFNCYLSNSNCTYYYPADFFDEKCGIGKEYISFIQEAEEMRKNKTLWLNMPAVGFPTLTLNEICFDMNNNDDNDDPNRKIIPIHSNIDHTPLNQAILRNIGSYTMQKQTDTDNDNSMSLQCLTERISMLHVHKAGGTSLHAAFDYLSASGRQSKNTLQIRHKFFSPMRGNSKQRHIVDTSNHVEHALYFQALESLTQHATTYPQSQYEPEQHVVFAVVRDPVERFISSIGQALGASGSQNNQIGGVLKNVCVKNKETSAEVLKCIAKYVQKHGFWIELHFTPQVIDISFTTLFTDIPIATFNFKDIGTVLDTLGMNPATKRRDGSASHYRSDQLLTGMTVDDYDEETLKIVCDLYKMDVLMQQSLGMKTRCDSIIET